MGPMKTALLGAALATGHFAPATPELIRPEFAAAPLAPALSGPLLSAPSLTPQPVPPAAATPPVEHAVVAAKALFDGGRAGKPGEGWSLGAFEGDGGSPVLYKSRAGGDGPARVYAGGLALNESFEPLFAREEKTAGHELFVWTRGHAPSPWNATKNPIDADARDLAKAIGLAAAASKDGKVELALHSFGTLVFQRMVQLHAEPAVKAALDALKDSRVFLLHATTHFDGSEKQAGPDFERMGQATKTIVDWLDAGDAMAAWWGPAALPWTMTRGQVIAAAAKEAAAMMKKDLTEPWDPAIDRLRKAFLKDLAKDTKDSGWQEAMLRRSSDMFRLEFSLDDAARIRKLGIRLELVHADGDKLLNWESARVLFERLGIDTPVKAPPSGTVLRDKTGRFRARIVSGDHYFPLKKPGELAEILK